jgi:hypothetical protein
MTRVALLAAIAALLAGCSVGPLARAPVVDGWPIGSEFACASDLRCNALMPVATAGFDRRDPGHPQIVRASLHREGSIVDSQGNHMLMTRSGSCCSVAVFELADGSIRAIGVGYPGVSQTPVAVDDGP